MAFHSFLQLGKPKGITMACSTMFVLRQKTLLLVGNDQVHNADFCSCVPIILPFPGFVYLKNNITYPKIVNKGGK